MAISISYLNRSYCFHLVNSGNPKLQEMGLSPLFLNTYPLYINLTGNIFFGGNNHYECRLSHDVAKILKVMNSNTYDRFETVYGFLKDNYTLHFSIYNHQIFFSDFMSLSIYKRDENIRKQINEKYGLKDEFYEPTWEEVNQDYLGKYILKNATKYGYAVESIDFNLTPQEFFERMISFKHQELKPYKSSHQLNGYDVRNWLNLNANVFMEKKCPLETTGIYSDEAMILINHLLETKLEIYDFFHQFSQQATNWQSAIKELLIQLGKYSEYHPPVSEDFINDIDDYAERCYWDGMFYSAAPDLLVQFVGFDKIESQNPRTITTSKRNIHEEFFNFLLMDYDIVQIPRLVFDKNTQHFRWIYPSSFINAGTNRECEEEIQYIKRYVPYEERYRYFKS